ncbi:MAG: S-layer homology domain-containing protein, partial [Peptococcaceae bacterium]|nr:S-layer homology domain-containing protein [Peptococcaceae bacterium]
EDSGVTPPPTVYVTGITVTGGAAISAKGGTLQLTAHVTPGSATDKTVAWSVVSGGGYAAVDGAGLVTAKADGKAVIRAAARDGSDVYGEITVTVSGQTSGGGGSPGGGGGGGDGGGSGGSPGEVPPSGGGSLGGGGDSGGGGSLGGGASTANGGVSAADVSAQDTKNEPVWRNPFVDVRESDWFYGDVVYAARKGLLNGTSAAAFSPGAPMTRAMLVTVLHRLSGSPSAAGSSGMFSDVAADAWYAGAMAWAAENGLAAGIGGGLFAPDASVTRQDLTVLFLRYARYIHKELPPKYTYVKFADDSQIAGYARLAVENLYEAGVVGGKPGNLFDPYGSATRAETAAMLHRLVTIFESGSVN